MNKIIKAKELLEANGYMVWNMSTKICTDCGQEKDIGYFSTYIQKLANGERGIYRRGYCIKCHNENRKKKNLYKNLTPERKAILRQNRLRYLAKKALQNRHKKLST